MVFFFFNIEGFIPSKIDRERQILYGITYMWNTKEMVKTSPSNAWGTTLIPGLGTSQLSQLVKKLPGLIPWSGRSTGEGIGYPHQYSCTSLVAQLVKNLPAMRETWVQSLSWEEPLEKGKATHSSILAWRIPWAESMGSQRVGHDWATFTFTGN